MKILFLESRNTLQKENLHENVDFHVTEVVEKFIQFWIIAHGQRKKEWVAMGEIIIKIPEDVKEVINLDLPYKEIRKKIEEIEKSERARKALEILRKYKGTVEIEEVSNEELHMQGD